MPLPKISAPEYECILPSNKTVVRYRPFLMREEKLLLMAIQGGDTKEMQKAVLNLLNECILDDIQIEKLPYFDVEYLFLQLRCRSVGESVDLLLKHPHETGCEHSQEVTVDLSSIEVKMPENRSDVIQFDNGVGLKMKYPSMTSIEKIDPEKSEIDNLIDMLVYCVDNVFDEENVYTDFTHEEMREFIESLSQSYFVKIQKYFEETPSLEHEITYTCDACGKQETVLVKGLDSFFT